MTVTYRRSLSCGMAGLTISSSLRWVAPLMAALGVLDDEDHGQGQGYHGLEYRFPTGGNPATMIHVAAAVTTRIAARGGDAYRRHLSPPGVMDGCQSRPTPPVRRRTGRLLASDAAVVNRG